MNAIANIDRIERLETEMRAFPQISIPVTHHFAPGVYAREVTIPAGSLVTGKIHKRAHLNIISKGEITVLTDDGLKRIKAPCTLLSAPGTKRVGLAHTDTVWTTIHGTYETDLGKIEAEFIAQSRDDYLEFRAALLLAAKE